MTNSSIPGGFILLSRKLLKSGIMDRPPLYLKLWVWMLLHASHKNHGDLKRGQFFTTLDTMRHAMAYKVGFRVERPSKKEIRGVTAFLTKVRMVDTMKVTHGLVITILNYDLYQTTENYEGHCDGQGLGHNTNKNDINNIVEIPFSTIIDHLNNQSGKNFRTSTQKTKNLIKARWKEGNREKDFFHVIDVKCRQWQNTPQEKYLRPETLFGTKFEAYLNERPLAEKPQPSTPEWF